MPTKSSANSVLTALTASGNYVSLGLEVAGVMVPLVKGLVMEIRKIGGSQGESVSYEIVLKTDAAELDDVEKLSQDDIAAINGELARLGKSAVPPSGA